MGLQHKQEQSFKVILNETKTKYSEGVPIVEVNFAAISVQSGISRDILISSVKAITRTLGEAVKSGSKVTADLPYVRYFCKLLTNR